MRVSSATIPIPASVGIVPQKEFIPFSSFSASGGGADFTNVGAIELEITGGANIDGIVELVGTLGSTVFTQNFDNFDGRTLFWQGDVDSNWSTAGNWADDIDGNDNGSTPASNDLLVFDTNTIGFVGNFVSTNDIVGLTDIEMQDR